MAIPFNWPSEEDTDEYYRRLDQLLADLYDVLRHILLRPRARDQQPLTPREQRIEDSRESSGVNNGGSSPGDGGGGDDGGSGGGPGGGNGLQQRLNPLPDLVADIRVDNNGQAASSTPRLQQRMNSGGESTSGRRRRSGSHRSRSSRRNRSRRRRQNPTTTTASAQTSGDVEPQPSTLWCKSSSFTVSPTTPCCAISVSHSLKMSAENWILVGHELWNIAEDFKKKEERTNVSLDRRQVEVKASSLLSLLVPAPFSGSVWTTVILLVGWRLLMKNR